MVPAEEYKRNAEQCLRLATVASDQARKAHLIAEAKGWLSLSVFADKTGPRRFAQSGWRRRFKRISNMARPTALI
jgi:hypothetical protein